jgi:type I restriction enzyme, S subunit
VTATLDTTPRYRPYPAYRDSGVEWLGEVPAHWAVRKIRRLCLVRRGASPRPIDDPIYFNDEGSYAWVRISDVTASEKYLLETEQKLSEFGQSKSVSLEPGDLFLSIAATVGKPIITKIKCCIHDGFVYFLNLKEDREYLYYVFLSGELYKGLGKLGTQLNLNTNTIGDIQIPLPSLPEQRAIIAFLDRETAKLDALIARKERLIALLEEKRAALISHAVTKGLDDAVPMKDSGVPWLGDVPAHWVVKPLGKTAHLQRGYDLSADQRKQGEVPVVTSGGITGFHDQAKTKGPGIVTGRYGTTGNLFYIEQDFWPHNTSLFVDNFFGNLPRYVYYLLKILPFDAHADKSAVPGIDRNDLHILAVCQPPLDEQESIISYIDYGITKLNTLIAKNRQHIGLLRERRATLIAAAVTGKIDVRGAA